MLKTNLIYCKSLRDNVYVNQALRNAVDELEGDFPSPDYNYMLIIPPEKDEKGGGIRVFKNDTEREELRKFMSEPTWRRHELCILSWKSATTDDFIVPLINLRDEENFDFNYRFFPSEVDISNVTEVTDNLDWLCLDRKNDDKDLIKKEGEMFLMDFALNSEKRTRHLKSRGAFEGLIIREDRFTKSPLDMFFFSNGVRMHTEKSNKFMWIVSHCMSIKEGGFGKKVLWIDRRLTKSTEKDFNLLDGVAIPEPFRTSNVYAVDDAGLLAIGLSDGKKKKREGIKTFGRHSHAHEYNDSWTGRGNTFSPRKVVEDLVSEQEICYPLL